MKISSKSAIDSYGGQKVIVMPYLSEPEISVDCFAREEGNVIIPRVKIGGRIQKIEYDKDVLAAADRLIDIIKPKFPVNIQFRYFKGKLKLLEINPRLSGNAHMSSMAANVNLPAAAAFRALGEEFLLSPNYQEKMFSYVETPVEV
jgi:predicted ATP-grasp superfamily ATP-dependent carboligase